ncbi:MAG: nucleoside deaminase [Bdellovibrionales bacterium]|jgi:tRNA(Arg) A34 adenosine deaminase TadA|nr:nucleoside deaminase [Bdellovibrionales bacterium]
MSTADPTSRQPNPQFMEKAIELSRTNMLAGAGGPFGAVVVKDGKIVGEGWNRVTSSNDPTAHAEVDAIRNACKNLGTFELKDCEIYTSCEPCPMCLAAIYWARIEHIYYGNTRDDAASIDFDDEFLYREIIKPMPERAIPITPFLRNKALAVFKEWSEKTDRVQY